MFNTLNDKQIETVNLLRKIEKFEKVIDIYDFPPLINKMLKDCLKEPYANCLKEIVRDFGNVGLGIIKDDPYRFSSEKTEIELSEDQKESLRIIKTINDFHEILKKEKTNRSDHMENKKELDKIYKEHRNKLINDFGTTGYFELRKKYG